MPTFSISELADAAGLPVRTVRYYQAAALLPRAERSGRSLQFDQAHLDRLYQIADLQQSGLKLSTIRDMLENGGHGKSPVVALMGAGPSGARWLTDSERTFTVPELAELLGDSYFHLLEPLERAGYLERRPGQGSSTWYCSDVPLLKAALELADIGADVELTSRARDLIQRRVRRLAEDLVEMWETESGQHFSGDAGADLAANLEKVRSVAWQAAAYVMASETDRAIRLLQERSKPQS